MRLVLKGYVTNVLALKYSKPTAIYYLLAVLQARDHGGSSKMLLPLLLKSDTLKAVVEILPLPSH